MKCPACGMKLSEVEVGKVDGWRCFRCGGWWLARGLEGLIDANKLVKWRAIDTRTTWIDTGTGVCPADQNKLRNATCDRCGRKWWSDTQLRNLVGLPTKPGWGRPGITVIITMVVMVGGLLVGLWLVRQPQMAVIKAVMMK